MSENITQRIARNFSWLIVGTTISGLANFALVMYLARVLGVAAFGILNFVLAFLSYLILFVDSGLSLLGTREIARRREAAGSLAVNILLVRFIIAVVVFALAVLLVILTPQSWEIKGLFILAFLFVFGRSLNTDWAFQGLETMKYIAWHRVLFSLSVLTLTAIFVHGPADLLLVPLMKFIPSLVLAGLFVLLIINVSPKDQPIGLTPKKWLHYWWQAVPLGASMILIQVYTNLDTIMLGFMDSAEVVGYYNAAYQVFFVLVGLFSLWQSTAIPVSTTNLAKDKNLAAGFITKYFRLTMLVVFPLVMGTFIAAPLIIKLLFGAAYQPASLALQLLIWILIPIAVGSTYGILILVPAGLYNQFLAAVMVGALVNVVLNFLLIPPYSFIGAAIATIMAEISAGTIALYFAGKVLKTSLMPFFVRPFLVTILAAAFAWVVARACNIQSTAWQSVVTMFIFALTYVAISSYREYGFIRDFI